MNAYSLQALLYKVCLTEHIFLPDCLALQLIRNEIHTMDGGTDEEYRQSSYDNGSNIGNDHTLRCYRWFPISMLEWFCTLSEQQIILPDDHHGNGRSRIP